MRLNEYHYIGNTMPHNYNSRFKLKPQYRMPDPTAAPRLLYHLLIVAITTLVVLVGSLCWAAWLNAKGNFVAKDV